MKDYIIVTDSSADLSADMVEKLNIEVLPLTFNMKDKVYSNYPDEREVSSKEVYSQLRGGEVITTSQVNSVTFTEFFEPFLAQGKDILYLGFSSGLSGTVNNAVIAADDLSEKYPENKIKVVDTLCASLGQGLLVYLTCKYRDQGKTIEETAQYAENTKLNLCHWFTVDDLHFLKRGGRVSSAAAIFGSMLSIKPVLHVDNDGHLIPMEKVRGRKTSLDALVKHMKDTATGLENQTVFISHGDCIEDANYVAEQVRALGVKDIYINFIGPVIGSHSGPGTVALFFLGSER